VAAVIGELLNRKALHAEDVGTRIQHMMELQEVWSDCYGILTRPNMYHTQLEEERAKQLSIALDLLQHHLESEYSLTRYAKVINEVSNKETP
jgi:hypothetical protein